MLGEAALILGDGLAAEILADWLAEILGLAAEILAD